MYITISHFAVCVFLQQFLVFVVFYLSQRITRFNCEFEMRSVIWIFFYLILVDGFLALLQIWWMDRKYYISSKLVYFIGFTICIFFFYLPAVMQCLSVYFCFFRRFGELLISHLDRYAIGLTPPSFQCCVYFTDILNTTCYLLTFSFWHVLKEIYVMQYFFFFWTFFQKVI